MNLIKFHKEHDSSDNLDCTKPLRGGFFSNGRRR